MVLKVPQFNFFNLNSFNFLNPNNSGNSSRSQDRAFPNKSFNYTSNYTVPEVSIVENYLSSYAYPAIPPQIQHLFKVFKKMIKGLMFSSFKQNSST